MALSLLSPGTAQVFVKLHDGPLRRKNTCSPRKIFDGTRRWASPLLLSHAHASPEERHSVKSYVVFESSLRWKQRQSQAQRIQEYH